MEIFHHSNYIPFRISGQLLLPLNDSKYLMQFSDSVISNTFIRRKDSTDSKDSDEYLQPDDVQNTQVKLRI